MEYSGATYDGTSQSSYVDGYYLGTKASSLKTTDRSVEIGWRAGSRSFKDSAASDGDFAELLIYDRVLSYAEQRQVEDYLSAKWFGDRPLSPGNPLVWIDPKTNCLTSFSYSKETGRLLFTRSDNGRDALLHLDTDLGADGEFGQVMQGRFLQNVQWTRQSGICLYQPGNRASGVGVGRPVRETERSIISTWLHRLVSGDTG